MQIIALVTLALAATLCAANPLENSNESKELQFGVEEFSQIALPANDDDETAELKGDMRAYEGFCISTRDMVFAHIKAQSNKASFYAYNIMFEAVADTANVAVKSADKAKLNYGKQLAKPSSPITDDASDPLIVEGQEEIQKKETTLQAFKAAFEYSLLLVARNTKDAIQSKWNALVRLYNPTTVMSSMNDVCTQVKQMKEKIANEFDQFNADLVEEDPKYAEFVVTMVPCVTSQSVDKLTAVCEFVENTKESVVVLFSSFLNRNV